MLPPDGQFLFGRVIDVNANPLGVGGAILVYIFRARSRSKEVVPELRVRELLVPPLMTNRLPWSRGYFEFLVTRELKPKERLPRHCFERGWTAKPQYFDEFGNRCLRRVEPVGLFGLHSFQTIDDEISRALGIPLATDE